VSIDRTEYVQIHRRAKEGGGTAMLNGKLLTVARFVWLLIAVLSIALFVAGIPLRYEQLLEPCLTDSCVTGQLAPEEMMTLQDISLSLVAYAIYSITIDVVLALVYCTVGLAIFWRQSRERMAFLASLWLVTFGVTFSEFEVRALATSYPELQPLVTLVTFLGGVALLLLFMFIFPNGRFVPRWTRWLYLVTMIFFLAYGYLEVFVPQVYANLAQYGVAAWMTMVLSGIGAQAYRYLRISEPIERQQTKWVMFGLLVVLLGIVILASFGLFGLLFNRPDADPIVDFMIQTAAGALAFAMIPVMLGFSILRYRLWDIDIVVRRTLVYGLLTIILVLVYFVTIILLQNLFTAISGQQSPVAIVISTLAIAALFQPLRRRVQDIIDRRFFRRKYDATLTLAYFAKVAQEEVDLDPVATELLAVVQQTMQPERVSLWLKEQKSHQSQA
jgi:hypothetical protein